VQRHLLNRPLSNIVGCLAKPDRERVGFRHAGHVDGRLGQRKIALRHPDRLHSMVCSNGLFQSTRIGEADVL